MNCVNFFFFHSHLKGQVRLRSFGAFLPFDSVYLENVGGRVKINNKFGHLVVFT